MSSNQNKKIQEWPQRDKMDAIKYISERLFFMPWWKGLKLETKSKMSPMMVFSSILFANYQFGNISLIWASWIIGLSTNRRNFLPRIQILPLIGGGGSYLELLDLRTSNCPLSLRIDFGLEDLKKTLSPHNIQIFVHKNYPRVLK